jgi:hypothetical protein
MANTIQRSNSCPAALAGRDTAAQTQSPDTAAGASASNHAGGAGSPSGLRPRTEQSAASRGAALAGRVDASAISRLSAASSQSSASTNSIRASEADSGYLADVGSFRADSSASLSRSGSVASSGYGGDESNNIVDQHNEALGQQLQFLDIYEHHANQAAADAVPSDTESASSRIAANR